MTSKQLQTEIKERLARYFGDTVVKEWPISRGAGDTFARNLEQYSPQIDIAVYTIGVQPGNVCGKIKGFWAGCAPDKLKNLFEPSSHNPNPRCALAVEVVFGGPPKYILGDITNASMMGLHGIVVPSKEMEMKVRMVWKYISAIRKVGKAPAGLFSNTAIVPQDEFLQLID